MPAVRIEDDAFGDARYDELAEYLGLQDADHARGKMMRLWRQCTQETLYALPAETVARILGANGVDALIRSRLGERQDDGLIRIKGTKGRIEWLKKLRSNGRFGKKGGRPKKNPQGYPSGLRNKTPLATALALAPSTVLNQEREPDAIERLWAEQERLRSEAIPGSRGLGLTADRRKRIASLLESGHSEESLMACVREYAREARGNGGRWFNGETNWRPDNVARTLGQIGTDASPSPRQPRQPFLVPGIRKIGDLT